MDVLRGQYLFKMRVFPTRQLIIRCVVPLLCFFVVAGCTSGRDGLPSAQPSPSPIVLPTPTFNPALLYPMPDPSTLSTEYTLDANRCVVSASHLPPPTPQPIDEPELIRDYGNKTSDFYSARGQRYLGLHEYKRAASDFRHALPVPSDPSALRSDFTVALRGSSDRATLRVDYIVRLSLSIALFRADMIDAAKEQWRIMLSHKNPDRRDNDPSARGISLLRAGQYRPGFAELYLNPPSFNTISFGDSGAAAHLGSGLLAATKGRYDDAMREWQLSVTCSNDFQVPHLMMGFIYQMRGQNSKATEEWIRTLQGWDPASPDSAGITGTQYYAMTQLV